MSGSFRFWLASYFVVISLLPLATAWWAFSAVADRSVRTAVDARLDGGLRAAVAAYEDELRRAQTAAATLARRRTFQRAVAERDLETVVAQIGNRDWLRLEGPGDFDVGGAFLPAGERRVRLEGAGGSAALVAYVPLDAALLAKLRSRSGLEGDDALVLLQDGAVLAGPRGLDGPARVTAGRIGETSVGERKYRGAAVPLARGQDVSLAALTPVSAITAEQRAFQNQLLLALLAAVALVGCVAYFAGRRVVDKLGRLSGAAHAIAAGDLDERVDVRGRDEFAELGRAFNEMAGQLQARLADLEDERRRLREATSRLGEALAVTLDIDQLQRLIVETAVDATGAEGGYLLGERGELVHAGDPNAGPDRVEVPLSAARASFGTLVLLGPEFDEEARMTAASLAAQASIALENARLHRHVQRQALVDGLTGLANRRRLDQDLAQGLARAERLGGSLALILADLDDFKAVNDQHGHPTGDAVLQEFADVLRESIREMDVAGRWGGEEFAVVLPGTDEEGAAHVAERLRRSLEQRVILAQDGIPVPTTVSIGVAAYPAADSRDALVDAADEALYQAKRAGKNRVTRAEHARERA